MLVARAIEGIGSSLIKTAVFCLLAETFVEDEERKIAISHALGGIALGIFGEFSKYKSTNYKLLLMSSI